MQNNLTFYGQLFGQLLVAFYCFSSSVMSMSNVNVKSEFRQRIIVANL